MRHHIYFPDALPVVIRNVAAARHPDPGVVAEQVDGAMHLQNMVDQRRHFRLAGHIARNRLPALDIARHLRRRLGLNIGDNHRLRALRGKPHAQRPADAAGAAGHDHRLSQHVHRTIITTMPSHRILSAVLLFLASSSIAQDVRRGDLPPHWITGGPKSVEVPDWQIHEYNEDLYILRESGCTHYEKPFLYLLFGHDRALLEDTGSGHAATAPAVQGVIAHWLARNKRESIPLVVAHSHSHGDHIAGDSQFQSLPGVTMVPLSVPGTQEFYGIQKWPEEIGRIDLGGRILDVIPIPGHDTLSIALYDRQTGILFTGDSLYPGRIYVRDFSALVASNQRLVDFTRGKPVTHILGCHIEQSTTPYQDYPVGTAYQPEEHSLSLSRAHLLEMNDALQHMNGTPQRLALSEFTIWPVTPR